MANTINKSVTLVTNQAAGQTATANGTSVDISGAQAVLVNIDESAGTAGIITFERSVDGNDWTQAGATRLADNTPVTNSATTAAENGLFSIAIKDGANLFRARISTAWSGAGALTRTIVLR